MSPHLAASHRTPPRSSAHGPKAGSLINSTRRKSARTQCTSRRPLIEEARERQTACLPRAKGNCVVHQPLPCTTQLRRRLRGRPHSNKSNAVLFGLVRPCQDNANAPPLIACSRWELQAQESQDFERARRSLSITNNNKTLCLYLSPFPSLTRLCGPMEMRAVAECHQCMQLVSASR